MRKGITCAVYRVGTLHKVNHLEGCSSFFRFPTVTWEDGRSQCGNEYASDSLEVSVGFKMANWMHIPVANGR